MGPGRLTSHVTAHMYAQGGGGGGGHGLGHTDSKLIHRIDLF